VDHGTALSLAGTGLAKADSLKLAVTMAQKFASR
jgi:4-hydroxy-L-threonine phosphate dehydrogenase PdxA